MASLNQILVFAAHPDDEVLGCGGTIARHVQEGDNVAVTILAEGITSRSVVPGPSDQLVDELSALAQSARSANRILGVAHLELLSFPDNRMDAVPFEEVLSIVRERLQRWKPRVVYTHHGGDVNVDHRIIHEAVVRACATAPWVEELLCFEVPSSTEWQPAALGSPFLPDVFVEVSDSLKLKMEALRAYASEMRPFPHARSFEAVEALARWRGASSGVNAAEAFSLKFRMDLF